MRRNGHIFSMAQGFLAAVNGKMLRSGNDFQVFRIVALQAGDESNTDAAGEKGIFAVGFLAASPAWVSKDVDVGRPKGEAVVAAGISVLDSVVVFGACFRRDDVSQVMNKVRVPGGGKADGLRKNGGVPGARNAVQGFVPPVVGGNTKARDCTGDVLHLRSFFFQRHARD